MLREKSERVWNAPVRLYFAQTALGERPELAEVLKYGRPSKDEQGQVFEKKIAAIRKSPEEYFCLVADWVLEIGAPRQAVVVRKAWIKAIECPRRSETATIRLSRWGGLLSAGSITVNNIKPINVIKQMADADLPAKRFRRIAPTSP